MRPRVVGYGSSGRAPPNSVAACYEAFDSGADAVAVDVCTTGDGVLVVGNHRMLRLLRPGAGARPAWAEIKDADVGAAFSGTASPHRLLVLDEFLEKMGPLSISLVARGEPTNVTARFSELVAQRRKGETTVVAAPEWLDLLSLPTHVPRVALLLNLRGPDDLVGVRADAVALPARALVSFRRCAVPKVALQCDTRPSLVEARAAAVVSVFTERPAWFRCTWSEVSETRA